MRRWLTRENKREYQGFGRCGTLAVNEEEDNNSEDEEGNETEEIRKGPQAKKKRKFEENEVEEDKMLRAHLVATYLIKIVE